LAHIAWCFPTRIFETVMKCSRRLAHRVLYPIRHLYTQLLARILQWEQALPTTKQVGYKQSIVLRPLQLKTHKHNHQHLHITATMDNKIRHLDDSSTTDTLLTLPRSDFPKPKTDTSTLLHNVEPPPQEEDRLLLVRLPSSKSGGVTMSDLTQGQTVYMLGDTSESDIDHSNRANGQIGHDDGEFDEGNNIHVPIPTRLIIEGKSEEEKGKTLELMRVETSNTYILVPPMPDGGDVTNGSPEGAMEDDIISNKRQKIDGDNTTKKLTTMPARSVGLIPGEESPACFFLEPVHLKQGHFASKLRWEC
jgi:hypothetical protein